LIADREPAVWFGPQLVDDSRRVDAGDVRRWAAGQLRGSAAGPERDVRRVHRDCVDSDAKLARSRLGIGKLNDLEYLGTAELHESDRLHRPGFFLSLVTAIHTTVVCDHRTLLARTCDLLTELRALKRWHGRPM
jgi:hypothetical protein